MLFIEIRETQCAYVLEVRLRQYKIDCLYGVRENPEVNYGSKF